MAASTFPSTQWATFLGPRRGYFAGSDIMLGAPVTIASSGDATVVMCVDKTTKPIGVARDYAVTGDPVTVFVQDSQARAVAGAGASTVRESYVGVVGTSSGAHPQSGNTVTYPLLGAIIPPGSPVGTGTAGSSVWAVGQAVESAATGDQFLFNIEPRLLAGLGNA